MSPPSLKQWLFINVKIGSLSFGSTSRILLYQDEIVDRRAWLTGDEFQEALTLSQMLPGPNLVNFGAYVGFKLFSFRGATLGTVGLALPGALLAVLVLSLVPMDDPNVREVVRGITIGSIALIGLFVWRLVAGLKATAAAGVVARPYKIALRVAIAAIVAAFMLGGFPFFPVLIFGIAGSLAVEFLA